MKNIFVDAYCTSRTGTVNYMVYSVYSVIKQIITRLQCAKCFLAVSYEYAHCTICVTYLRTVGLQVQCDWPGVLENKFCLFTVFTV